MILDLDKDKQKQQKKGDWTLSEFKTSASKGIMKKVIRKHTECKKTFSNDIFLVRI